MEMENQQQRIYIIDSVIGKITIDEKYKKAVDLDGDGQITITDVSLLRKQILGLD